MGEATHRIQRRRTKGWRMPEGAVYVGRGSMWGNPWAWRKIASHGPWEVWNVSRERRECVKRTEEAARAQALAYFEDAVTPPRHRGCGSLDFAWTDVARLRGKVLVCWCRIDEPCHADILLELANAPLRCAAVNA